MSLVIEVCLAERGLFPKAACFEVDGFRSIVDGRSSSNFFVGSLSITPSDTTSILDKALINGVSPL